MFLYSWCVRNTKTKVFLQICSVATNLQCDINGNNLMIWSLKLSPKGRHVMTLSTNFLKIVSIWWFVIRKLSHFHKILKAKLSGAKLLFKVIYKFWHFKIRFFGTFGKVANNFFFFNFRFYCFILVMAKMVKLLR